MWRRSRKRHKRACINTSWNTAFGSLTAVRHPHLVGSVPNRRRIRSKEEIRTSFLPRLLLLCDNKTTSLAECKHVLIAACKQYVLRFQLAPLNRVRNSAASIKDQPNGSVLRDVRQLVPTAQFWHHAAVLCSSLPLPIDPSISFKRTSRQR
jgi:hypothetical protein